MIIDDLIIALFVLAGVRIIAFLVFLMIYIQKRKLQHLILAVGWFIYFIGPVVELLNYNPGNQIINPVQGYTASLATYILMLSILLYIKNLKNWLVWSLIFAFAVPAAILIVIFPGISGFVTIIIQACFIIVMLILVVFNRTSIQRSKSNLSFYWMCITLFLGLSHAIGSLLVFPESALSLRMAITFIVNLSFLEFFIYLDWEHVVHSLEKSDARFRILFETAPTALLDTDLSVFRDLLVELKSNNFEDLDSFFKDNPEKLTEIPKKMKIFDANTKALSLLGAKSIEEFINNINLLFSDATNIRVLRVLSEDGIEKNELCFEVGVKTLNGDKKDILLNCSKKDVFADELLTTISLVDVTEKNNVQKRIETALHEKEILLQEVHHRVKNNLTIISSILGFQSNNSDEATKDIIRSIDNRINTMAIVHEQLYRSRNLKEIDFSTYVKELVDDIDTSFVESLNTINVTYDMDPVYLEINLLIPAGMLINEIITNSYKHAFAAVDKPEITIGLHIKDNMGVLSIRDNGCSFAEKIFNNDVDTTGFLIIKALVQQLGGELVLNLEKGTEFIISIPFSDNKSPVDKK